MAEPAEFELKRTPALVKSFGGCGVQFNHHVFAPQTLELGVPEASFVDLEKKVVALAPHFVRVFYNDQHDGVPFNPALPPSPVNRRQLPDQDGRWKSFVKVVELAQKTGATINITWQGGPLVTEQQRETSAARFANVLEILVKGGISNLRWVTLANEPNTAPKKPRRKPGEPPAPKPVQKLTPERLGATYRHLDRQLRGKGIRKQIRFMGGDLIEGSTDPKSAYNQARWFEHMSKHMGDILDAYSTHIYWGYTDVRRFKKRLNDVRDIVQNLAHPMPVYITEYGTRGKDRRPNTVDDPGNFHDGSKKIPLRETNIAAFQHAWLQILAAQLGYAGMVKWDCYFGRYDKARQAYYAIGPPGPPRQPKEWQLYPMYFLLRLITMTTAPGWKVLTIKPSTSAPGTKHLAAFQGNDKDLTILGLDERGATLNKPSKTQVPYTIGGLPPRASFKLVLWNRAGKGRLVVDRTIAADASGVAKITVPLHSVFALTTKALPPAL